MGDNDDFDPDKTVVDIRRPDADPEPYSDSDEDRTVVITRRPTPPESPDSPPPTPPPVDTDATMVAGYPPPKPPSGSAADADRTFVGGPGAPAAQSAADADFQIASLSGASRGQRFPVGGLEVLIGSNPSCGVALPGAEAIHAKLTRRDDSYELQNLGPVGSVIVRGRKPGRIALEPGDLIKIGDEVVRFARSGDVFSSEYSEAELTASSFDISSLKENPLLIVGGVVAIAIVAYLALQPQSGPQQTSRLAEQVQGNDEEAMKREVESLLAAGELLFNEGRYVAPSDRPTEDDAYKKFNAVLNLDPGNAAASEWLRKVDGKLEEQRNAREDAERRRRAQERERRERERQELAAKVEAVLQQGDALYEKGQIAEPIGRNALAKYRAALEIDPESEAAKDRIRQAIFSYVDRGDDLRDAGQEWKAIEQYRKAQKAAGIQIEEVDARVEQLADRLKSGMASTGSYLVMYKNDAGQLFVFDNMDKVPAQFRDRAVEVHPIEE